MKIKKTKNKVVNHCASSLLKEHSHHISIKLGNSFSPYYVSSSKITPKMKMHSIFSRPSVSGKCKCLSNLSFFNSYTQGCFTFEAFLVKDDCVVLWCLRQTEELTSETGEEVQMERGMPLESEKT